MADTLSNTLPLTGEPLVPLNLQITGEPLGGAPRPYLGQMLQVTRH